MNLKKRKHQLKDNDLFYCIYIYIYVYFLFFIKFINSDHNYYDLLLFYLPTYNHPLNVLFNNLIQLFYFLFSYQVYMQLIQLFHLL